MCKRWLLAIILAVSVGLLYQVGQAEDTAQSLFSCIVTAYENSSAMAINRALGSKAALDVANAKAVQLPTVGIGGNYSYVSETMELQLPAIPPRSISFGDGQNTDLNLHVDALLYAGGSLKSSARASKHLSNETEARLQSDSLSLLRDVRNAWLNALAQQENLNAVNANVKRLERHLGQVDKAIANGMASRDDRLKVEISLNRFYQKRAEAENMLNKAGLGLGVVVGKSGEIVFPDGDLAEPINGFDAGEFQLEQQPAMAQLNNKSAAMAEMKNAAEGRLRPTVSAQAAYHYGKPGVNQVQDEWMDYFTVGVGLNWTIWDWNSRKNSIQKATLDQRIIAHQTKATADFLTYQHSQAENEFLNAQAVEAITQKRLELEQEQLRIMQLKFSENQITESTILDVYDDLALVEIEHTMAQFKIRLAEAALLYSIGK